jgi:Spy/CpxP family protein refolding chaperone
MSDKQQARLITLIENQAADRHEIRQTARQALIRLQQLAIEQHYDETQARQLAQTYGNALAELALLDIQVASQIHDMLTPLQREALQNTIENW